MGAGMNTMNIHGVTRITVAEPKILNCRGGVHIRNVTIEHKGGEFEIALIGADVGEGGPVEAVTVGDPLFHDYQEACDDLATLCAERDELAGKLEAAQNVVENLFSQVGNLEMEVDRLRQEVDRLHDKVREEASA